MIGRAHPRFRPFEISLDSVWDRNGVSCCPFMTPTFYSSILGIRWLSQHGPSTVPAGLFLRFNSMGRDQGDVCSRVKILIVSMCCCSFHGYYPWIPYRCSSNASLAFLRGINTAPQRRCYKNGRCSTCSTWTAPLPAVDDCSFSFCFISPTLIRHLFIPFRSASSYHPHIHSIVQSRYPPEWLRARRTGGSPDDVARRPRQTA